ncbi:glycosyl transferase group 1 [Ruminococcus sp. CAG:403]|nr:glycosyl transferase group 1 [Ruminococcus sp. CAG:403]
MRIAFDATAILGPMSKNRGIGNYVLSQFLHMIRQDPDNQYFFLNWIDKDFHLSDQLPGVTNLTEDFIDTGSQNVLLREKACEEVMGAILQQYLQERQIDVFYITSPFESNFVSYRKEWLQGVRTVATVYDIIPYVMKEHYLTDPVTNQWYMGCIERLRWVDSLLVISESVKSDLVQYLHFDPERIHVIWGAVDDHYQKIEIPEETRTALFQKYHITKPFIMCTGGEDKRKNLDGLIRAYGLLPQELRSQYQLVVVCKLSAPAQEQLQAVAKHSHVEQDVIFTNFVTTEELLQFYNLAALMAFPSKYEGFGLPIVEAWACGTPVVTSNNSSLAQIGGDAAILVSADSDADIAAGMERALQPQILEELTKKGEERLALYRWERVAEAAIGFLNQITPLEAAQPAAPVSGSSAKRIACFTPLPPLESGISDYSVDIIRALSAYCSIDVYVDTTYTPQVSLPETVQILPHTAYPERRTQYQATLYQMGNSSFHFYMYPYLQKYRGIVVLHDYNLHGSIYDYAMRQHKQDLSLYRSCLLEDYREEQLAPYLEALANGTANPNIYEMEANGLVTNYADTIIVHSQESKYKLLQADIARSVTVIPSYTILEPLPDARAAKEALGIAPDTILLAAFGGIHATKRAIPILRAFGKLRQEVPNVHLLFAGKLAENIQTEFEQVVQDFQMQNAVTVTGYITLEQFQKSIDATDICLNLRYPSNGETSGSLMRILGKGKCVLVNDIGSFSELPDAACVKLPSVRQMGERREPDVIYDALKRLIQHPEERVQLEQAARAYAEQNLDIRLVAEQYWKALTQSVPASPVTEQTLEAVRHSEFYSISDAPGLAHTLASAKQIGRGSAV